MLVDGALAQLTIEEDTVAVIAFDKSLADASFAHESPLKLVDC
jgi:hypothetical protein